MLDGLHEDLNRVTKKPYVEAAERKDGETDEAVAMAAWMGYLKRNRSIIVDIFQGQLRSALTCRECKHQSMTFDPFMYVLRDHRVGPGSSFPPRAFLNISATHGLPRRYLSLPLPSKKRRRGETNPDFGIFSFHRDRPGRGRPWNSTTKVAPKPNRGSSPGCAALPVFWDNTLTHLLRL